MVVVPRQVWPLQCALGEGPLWISDEAALYFVDIKGGVLHRYHPETEMQESFAVGGAPSFIVRAGGGGLLVGSGDAIYRFSGSGLDARIVTIAQPAHNRTNDATVDPEGRLWFGTMDDEERAPTGALWSLERGVLSKAGPEAVVTNGPAVSANGRWLYHVDSVERCIWRFAVAERGALTDGSIFLQLGDSDGYPDGVVVDSEDCLWVALWDGWGVRRYAPSGELLVHIALPCARVTKLAFGGSDLRTAYVTTARVGLSDDALAAQPLAGSLFAFEAPAAGLPAVPANFA